MNLRLAWVVVLCTIAVGTRTFALADEEDAEEWRVDSDSDSVSDMSLPAFPSPPHSARTDLSARLSLALSRDSDEEASVDPIARFREELEAEEQTAADEQEIEPQHRDNESEEVTIRFVERPKKKKSKSKKAKKPKAKKAKAPKAKHVALRGGDEAPIATAARTAAVQFLPYGGAPNGYDSRTLPAGPLPVQPIASAQDSYARAHVRPQSIGQAAFQPIHNSERQFAGAPSVRNLAASRNNYAWADARRDSAYGYGNTLVGAPVNAAYYPPHWASPVPTPVAPAQPTGPTAFTEIGAATHMQQQQQMAPARNPALDSYASNYGAYTSNGAWPSAIAPPAAYYLPPDLVI